LGPSIAWNPSYGRSVSTVEIARATVVSDASLAPQNESVLPILTPQAIEFALRRLPDDEVDTALRQRLFPAAWAPGKIHYATGNEAAERIAAAAGLDVRAIADATELRRAMQKVFGRRLNWLAAASLPERLPGWSARVRLTGTQSLASVALAVTFLVLAANVSLSLLGIITTAALSVFFLMVIGLRVLSALPQEKPKRMRPSSTLPVYTVLVPLFRETRILRQLRRALLSIDYPHHLLDIKLVIERDDLDMRRALARFPLPSHMEVILVPPVGPRTKPKALNYALAFARGELLTIYDAEDVPEPDQLRRAAAMFAVAPPSLACLQAELSFYNPDENWLARQFTAEYAWLFGRLLPALAKLRLPILLGGTSNHFRTSVLRQVGAWDAYNVTEDADLGIRLARFGFDVGVLKSRTYEEANCRIRNWMSQRSRWLKGWMQTWLVHMRNPARLAREIGIASFCSTQALLLGVIISALFHPLFLGLVAVSISSGGLLSPAADLAQTVATGVSLAVLVSGYGASILATALGLRQLGIRGWMGTLLTMPLYWLLISAASWLALWQLLVAPFHWNKTEHGLSPGQLDFQFIPRRQTGTIRR
jgi:cellulose synthase/poly-beta-1,6-N-acetylglucosamine synthase-like glycosyltransferase